MRSRRTFTAEFKREAVRQLKLGDKTASEIARELAIPRTKLYSWRDELESNGDGAFPGKGGPGSSSKLAAEVARLKKELADAQEENEILKKAAAFFARDLK
jgi:transposase